MTTERNEMNELEEMTVAEQPIDYDPAVHGGCPVCGGNDEYLNVCRGHWFVCHMHRKRWFGGHDVFPTWQNETADDWLNNYERIRHYDLVNPVYEPKSPFDPEF